MYHTGVAAGHNGPTVLLLKGKKRKSGFNENFLRQEGCELGSTICMTENAYMTEEAWEGMAPSIVKGYRALPVVKDNPQWLMIEIFDGFGAHLTNLNALKQRAEAKILSITRRRVTRPHTIKHMISTLPRVTNIINNAHLLLCAA
jgi:hypothetical protein